MKRLFYLFIALFAISCTTNEKVENSFIINGKIENLKGDKFLFIKPKLAKSETDTITVSAEGKFKFTKKIAEAGFYKINSGRVYLNLYISPGDSLDISMDVKNINNSISISGKGEKANNLVKKVILMKNEQIPGYRELYSLEEANFTNLLDSVEQNILSEIDAFKQTNPGLSEKFINAQKASINFTIAEHKSNYAPAHSYFAKKDDFKSSPKFNEYIKKLNINDDKQLGVDEFNSFIVSYTHNKTNEAFSEDDDVTDFQFMEKAFETANEIFTNKNILEFVKFKSLTNHIKYSGIKGIEPFIKDFNETSTNKDFVALVKEKAGEWEHLKSGNIAPDFHGTTIAGDTVKLSDFKGKYVYVDVWATWCGPCVREIPKLKELEEKYHDKNIVFMSMSLDDNRDSWETMVEAKELKGVQIHAKEAWNSSIADDYLIKSIPRFIFIDKEGKIIDCNAERPSGKIDEQISQLTGL